MEDNFNKIINGVKNDLLKIKRKNQSEICKSKPKKIRLDHRYFQFDLLGQHSLCHHAESNSVFFFVKKKRNQRSQSAQIEFSETALEAGFIKL